MLEVCENCKYWQVLPIEGQCRRHAPNLIVASCGVDEVPEYSNNWATMGKDDWCGEFEPRKYK